MKERKTRANRATNNMTIIYCPDTIESDTVRKKFGRPNKFGQQVYGVSRYGEDNDFAGIYQVRHGRAGLITVREKFYIPTYRRSTKQNTQRNKFTSAIMAWQALTAPEKFFYDCLAVGLNKSGYNIFIGQQMLAA